MVRTNKMKKREKNDAAYFVSIFVINSIIMDYEFQGAYFHFCLPILDDLILPAIEFERMI